MRVYESIGSPLPGLKEHSANQVARALPGIEVVHDLADAFERRDDVWIMVGLGLCADA